MATPSGKRMSARGNNARRNGTVNRVPKMPPVMAIKVTCHHGKRAQTPISTSAGSVKITPAASASPADAAVCTILLSRVAAPPQMRKQAMAMTAAGIEAQTVMPANNPR